MHALGSRITHGHRQYDQPMYRIDTREQAVWISMNCLLPFAWSEIDLPPETVDVCINQKVVYRSSPESCETEGADHSDIRTRSERRCAARLSGFVTNSGERRSSRRHSGGSAQCAICAPYVSTVMVLRHQSCRAVPMRRHGYNGARQRQAVCPSCSLVRPSLKQR